LARAVVVDAVVESPTGDAETEVVRRHPVEPAAAHPVHVRRQLGVHLRVEEVPLLDELTGLGGRLGVDGRVLDADSRLAVDACAQGDVLVFVQVDGARAACSQEQYAACHPCQPGSLRSEHYPLLSPRSRAALPITFGLLSPYACARARRA